MEPRPGTYAFDWLDRVVDLLAVGGVFVDLATAPPRCRPDWHVFIPRVCRRTWTGTGCSPARGNIIACRAPPTVGTPPGSPAPYADNFCAGRPPVTRNDYRAGAAYYLGTELEPAFLASILRVICDDLWIQTPFAAPAGVETGVRRGDGGAEYLFLLNHNDGPANVSTGRWLGTVNLLTGEACEAQIELPANGVAVLQV